MYHPQRNEMYAEDALCVAAITVVYPGIWTAEYLGGNEFVERDSENRRPDHARKVVCHLQDPRVATADVSASQQSEEINRFKPASSLIVIRRWQKYAKTQILFGFLLDLHYLCPKNDDTGRKMAETI